jgi:hypothetical protein
MIKRFVISAVLVAGLVGTAQAQITQTQPNGAGGWNTYNSNGSITQTQPNGAGGYNTYYPNGSITQTQPNGAGGWNTYGTPNPGRRR